MNSMKRQKDLTLQNEPPRSVGVHMLVEKSREIASEGMKKLSQTGNAQMWMCLVVIIKSDAVKEQYCLGTWNVRSMNQDKLEVVKQEMAIVNIDIQDSVN